MSQKLARLLTTVLVVCAWGLASAGLANAADKLSVRLSYTPFAAHIPVYVANAKGYYKAAGLDVNILPGRGSTFAAMTVGANKEEFGIADPASVLAARAKGVPVIAVANLQQDNGVALVATEKSGITRVEDLKGRHVGILPGSTTTIFLQALLKKHGMTMNDFTAVTWRPGTDLPMLLDGKLDAEATVYNNEVITWGIEHPELKLRVWPMASLGFDTPGYALITSEDFANKNPKVVSAFVKATFKGTQYALQHPDEAVAILVKAAPELKQNIETAKWKATIPVTTSDATKKSGLGAMDHAKWENLDNLLSAYGVIKAKVDLNAVLKDNYR
ncbi:MAG TPA: ABC transporter substrate-binding protein [Nitrospira sp.]|nr:ABC transporter substrate-binding protein [Nitrospira sp.]